MFFALISTIITSFADVSWKKSLSFWVRTRAHALWSYPIALLIFTYFIINGFSILSVWLLPITVVLVVAVLDIIREPVSQQIYKEEKMSVIMPYLNLSRIFVIIISFFIYQDVSYITFSITILAIIIIIWTNIDFKHMQLPRCFSKIFFIEALKTIWILLWWWLILSYSEIMYFNIYILAYLMPTIFLAYTSGQLWDLIKTPVSFWFYRLISGLWWFSWFLSLIVIKNLGLSLSILLGFLWIWITLLVSYFFLKDTPSKKDIFLTITVSLLIWIWYYFK